MQVRLPSQPLRYHCHTFMHTHTLFFHSCKYTHFLKETKKHWITVGQWTKAGHHGNKLRGTGAGCMCVCGMGGELVSEVLILGKMGGLLQ